MIPITIGDRENRAPTVSRFIDPAEIPHALIVYAAWHGIDLTRVLYSTPTSKGELP